MRNLPKIPGKKICLILSIFLLCFDSYNSVIGQTYCQGIKIPRMWEKKTIGNQRETWFLKYKYQKLCDAIGKPEAKFIFYYKDDFEKMINHFKGVRATYLRVYFASYTEEGSSLWVPKNSGKYMTLIFVPVDENKKDIGDNYYTISPLNILDPAYKAFDKTNSKLPLQIKDDWINYYINNKLLPKLNSTINLNDPDNTNGIQKSDTKSILYDITYIDELITEISCQNASGIKAVFSSYTSNGTLKPDGTFGYKKRLLIQWELTEKIGAPDDVVFYIEDRSGYSSRPHFTEEIRSKTYKSNKIPGYLEGLKRFLTFNHGELCPEKCPN